MESLKQVFNECTSGYTKIADLEIDRKYRILEFERVSTQYGSAIMLHLEGFMGEGELTVYLPRRYNAVISDEMMAEYNDGENQRLHLVKRPATGESKYSPLEIV